LLAPPVGRLVGREASNRDGGDREGERPVAAPSASPQPAPPVAPVLLAYKEAAGRASSLTVLVTSAGGKGGTLVLVPPGTMTEVLSLGLEPVRQSLELGGPARLESTVENLLGAPLGGVVAVDDAGLTNLLAPAGPLPVNVPERVERVSPNGRVEVLYEAGVSTLAPAAAGRFLSAKGRESDLVRLTRHQAFWEAWLARLGDRPDAIPTRSPELKAAMAVLAAGPVDTRLVPVEAFGTAGDGGELYKVRGDELSRLVAGVFPTSAGQGLAGRPRVQVLNGTGAVEVADAVRAKLGAGFDVRLTGNAANFAYERTEIVFYDRDQEAVADRLRQALGVGALVLSRRPLDVVDVTVIVGKDFRP
ncbi:MAG TPA: LCP family protein, partial [Acidimicrobiales bacterium]|nr:LCP family protein [Acidimicrobiales bacterium]